MARTIGAPSDIKEEVDPSIGQVAPIQQQGRGHKKLSISRWWIRAEKVDDASRTGEGSVVIRRGKIEWVFYDVSGNEVERVVLDANGEHRMLNIEKDRWHSLLCLETGSILYESKEGPYTPLEGDEIMEAPAK